MQPHVELDSTRAPLLETGHLFWGWEIPVYLFLGGLVAGLMITVSAVILRYGKDRVTSAMRLGLLAAPVLLSLGMGALFLDLTLKLHVFRFYLTFRPSAPMSLGSWVLILVYPVQALLVLALPWHAVASRLPSNALLDRVRSLAERLVRQLAWAGLLGGIALGVYTGVLLSTTVANPLWSSSSLGFLFLVSGSSTGVAALMMAERDHDTQAMLARADIALIVAELAVIAAWIIGLATQGPLYREAVSVVVSGSYAPMFLGIVVFGGLLVPMVLEALALRGKAMHSRLVPALVLAGGLLLRFVIVYAGQEVRFFSV